MCENSVCIEIWPKERIVLLDTNPIFDSLFCVWNKLFKETGVQLLQPNSLDIKNVSIEPIDLRCMKYDTTKFYTLVIVSEQMKLILHRRLYN